jgi:hypothetical protein
MIGEMRELMDQLVLWIIIKMTKALKGIQEKVYLIIPKYNMQSYFDRMFK